MAPARLKVYRARMGFSDTVVAAPNQAAALKAWGARQNLFAEGLAAVAEDADAVAVALARPGVVLQRAAGTSAPFEETLASVPALPPAASRASQGGRSRREPTKPPAPPPDRSALDAAEAALAEVEAAGKVTLADLDTRRRVLEQERRKAVSRLAQDRLAAERRVEEARQAFARAQAKAGAR
jgi:hypothetical protein